jgi:hypothetical protein
MVEGKIKITPDLPPDQLGSCSGKAALEVSNVSRMPVALYPWMRIRLAGEFKG